MAYQTKASDEFLTDQPIADLAKKILLDIYFDPFGHERQLVKVRTMHTRETGSQPWPTTGPFFVNPPFSLSSMVVPRVADWVSKHKIDCLMLCLAAPGSLYWREAIWGPTGPQRIVWLPRQSFLMYDQRPTIVEHRTADGKLVKPYRYRELQRLAQRNVVAAVEKLATVTEHEVPNPLLNKVAPTEHTISYDTVLCLWSQDATIVKRFCREARAYGEQKNPGKAPIGISLGGGVQP